MEGYEGRVGRNIVATKWLCCNVTQLTKPGALYCNTHYLDKVYVACNTPTDPRGIHIDLC
jgi:hypothetical protein